MNEFDQFVKHSLRVKYYIRYADDFVFSKDRRELEDILRLTVVYLRVALKLGLHPNKVSITTLASGVDFLGWVHFAHHRILRTVTKRRMFRSVRGQERDSAILQSYLGLLRYGDTFKIRETMEILRF